MKKEKIQVVLYLGHKLTKASPEFLARMENMLAYLESELQGCCFLKFLGTKIGNSHDVFVRDIKTNVATCHLFIAVIDEESTGLGFETAAALYKYGKPVLVLYYRGAKVTRLILGAVIEEHEQMLERTYESNQDVAAAVRESIERFKLDTFSSATFPCLESMRPKHPYGNESPIYSSKMPPMIPCVPSLATLRDADHVDRPYFGD